MCAREGDHKFTLDKEDPADYSKELEEIYGNQVSPSDIAFMFEEWEYGEETGEEQKVGAETPEDVKHDTASAYDKVGASAHHEGNLKRAAKVMQRLGYSEEEFKIAGPDAYNF